MRRFNESSGEMGSKSNHFLFRAIKPGEENAVVDLQGRKPSIFKMVLRVLLLLAGPFELVVDIIWLTSEATRQTLRDKYVGTYVVSRNAVPIGKGRLQNVTLGFMGWNLMYREVKESNIK